MTDQDRSELAARVRSALDRHVASELAEFGGGLELIGLDDDAIVQVRFLGACGGCASTTYQFTMMVEATLKRHVPEVRFVEAIP